MKEMKKRLLAFVLVFVMIMTNAMLVSAEGTEGGSPEDTDSEWAGFTLHGYGVDLAFMVDEGNGPTQIMQMEMNTAIEVTNQTVAEQIDGMWTYSGTPTKEGATFEGWAKFYWENDEYGNSKAVFQKKSESEPYYTLDEVMNETLTRDTTYAAKWSDIPIDGYFNQYMVDFYSYGEGCVIYYSLYETNPQTIEMEWVEYTEGGFGNEFIAGISFEKQFANNYKIEKDPTRAGAKFEGWAKFKIDYATNEYTFVPQSETKQYYTTKEMLSSSAPEYPACFVPKWDDMDIEEYFPAQYYMVLNMNGGTVAVENAWEENGEEHTYSYETDVEWFWTVAKQSFRECLGEVDSKITGFNKAGEIVDSWTVYEFENLDYLYFEEGDTLPKNDSENIAVLYDTYEGEGIKEYYYLGMEGCKLVAESVSTADLLDTYKDANYYAVANWKKSVALVEDKEVTKVVSDEGNAIIDAIKNDREVKESVISQQTADQLQVALEGGKGVETKLVVYPMDETIVDKTERDDITKEATKQLGEDVKIQYLDIQVVFTMDDEVIGNLHELQKEIEVTLAIPDDMTAVNGKFVAIRNHDGKVDVLATTNNGNGTVTFKTDHFSTYALAYVQSSAATNAPNTGDNNAVTFYAVLTIVSLAAVVVLKKKDEFVR